MDDSDPKQPVRNDVRHHRRVRCPRGRNIECARHVAATREIPRVAECRIDLSDRATKPRERPRRRRSESQCRHGCQRQLSGDDIEQRLERFGQRQCQRHPVGAAVVQRLRRCTQRRTRAVPSGAGAKRCAQYPGAERHPAVFRRAHRRHDPRERDPSGEPERAATRGGGEAIPERTGQQGQPGNDAAKPRDGTTEHLAGASERGVGAPATLPDARHRGRRRKPRDRADGSSAAHAESRGIDYLGVAAALGRAASRVQGRGRAGQSERRATRTSDTERQPDHECRTGTGRLSCPAV
jgi:hypothetical protein